ncbi:MAG: hypothetical protein COV91_04560 [Candidatus Taylorbacteria bacterium CG11_big_fil_rev_8_21_14_0_20_46_11]|uniref:Uncharacterized protein n=1 Tax=Candidatus Taylorbacteria bacterium CG11_big_fil_rev_8_21_14_0_20_46_11 TaxID=1975025 RepID=A0A2H0KAT4_9BACT|nr:MAG: hypothetical protein COV91_04560 [Candidatus Taylorbacteria bacterium CG11_big_fil_rev_8_21_14_0_20_46_11]
MNSSNRSDTENILGAIIFPIIFGIFAFGTPFLPLIGKVLSLSGIALAGFFIAWSPAPRWCKLAITGSTATGFVLSLFARQITDHALHINLVFALSVFMVGYILGNRANPDTR